MIVMSVFIERSCTLTFIFIGVRCRDFLLAQSLPPSAPLKHLQLSNIIHLSLFSTACQFIAVKKIRSNLGRGWPDTGLQLPHDAGDYES